MGEFTGISWAHHTINIWTGCTKVSGACKFCYAETLSKRDLPNIGKWGPKAPRRPMAENGWKNLARWDRKAKAAGDRRRVFCSSLSDIGERNETMPEESWPVVAAQRARLWDEVEKCGGLDFLLLTKRPDHLAELLAARWPGGLPANIWAGTSVESADVAEERISALLRIPSRVRFLSMEPLLGPVDLTRVDLLPRLREHVRAFAERQGRDRDEAVSTYTEPAWLNALTGEWFDGWDSGRHERKIDWVIVGGESGAHARPMHPDWARSLRDQCVAADVTFHFKQWGEWTPGENVELNSGSFQAATWFEKSWHFQREDLSLGDGHAEEEPDVYRIGKHRAGRLLDGREWNEAPGEA